jgi:hypothetical protein
LLDILRQERDLQERIEDARWRRRAVIEQQKGYERLRDDDADRVESADDGRLRVGIVRREVGGGGDQLVPEEDVDINETTLHLVVRNIEKRQCYIYVAYPNLSLRVGLHGELGNDTLYSNLACGSMNAWQSLT